MKYPTIKEIKELLSQGGHISVTYEGPNPPKARVHLGTTVSKRIRPSTVHYLEEHNVIACKDYQITKQIRINFYFPT